MEDIGILITIVIVVVIVCAINKNKKIECLNNEYKAKRQEFINAFNPTRIIKTSDDSSSKPTEILINEKNKKFAILYLDTVEERQSTFLKNALYNSFEPSKDGLSKYESIEQEGNVVRLKEYDFSDLIDYELLESTESKLQGNGLMTTGGALLLGGVGALIGMNAGDRKIKNDKKFIIVNLQVNDLDTPLISIEFFNIDNQLEMHYDDCLTRAREVIAVLALIKSNAVIPEIKSNSTDIFKKLEKLAELREKNILTEEEFIMSKTQLLKKINE